jgi:hypothetical protein
LAHYPWVGRIRETEGGPPVAILWDTVAAVESVGAEVDLVEACRASLELGTEEESASDAPAAMRAVLLRPWILAQCPRSAAAQLIHTGEVELGTAVLRRSLASQPVTAFAVAERDWFNVTGTLGHALSTMHVGDACLALAIARQAAAAWDAFQLQPGADAVCAQRDCSAVGDPARLILGLERRIAAAPTVTLPLAPIANSYTAETAPSLVRRLDEMTHQPCDAFDSSAFYVLMRAIRGAGDLAVPALIARLEEPDALTQTRRENSYGYYFDVVTVHDLVRTFLDEVLVLRFSWAANDEGSMLEAAPDHAAIYRARFEVVRGMSHAQRSLELLRSSRDVREWRMGAMLLQEQMSYAWASNAASVATLREETGATAGPLMLRRVFDALRLGDTEAACNLAQAAVEWNLSASSRWARRSLRACARIPGCECGPVNDLTTDP